MKSKFSAVHRCRLCGREESNPKLRNIFDKSQELELEMKIAKLLPVVVLPWDPLPHKICFNCMEKLNLFNEFYDDTMKADEFLRKFFLLAPENEVENRNPIIEISDCAEVVGNVFKVKSNNMQTGTQKSVTTNISNKEVLENSVNKIFPVNQHFDNIPVEKSLDSFIINTISSTDSVYTCKKCFRTYTKQSAALSHTCLKTEKFEKAGNVDSEKSLPPLKIRLYSIVANKFVCDLCQKLFAKKGNVVKHIKSHFLNQRTKENNDKKVDRKKRKKKNFESYRKKTVGQLLHVFSSNDNFSNVSKRSFSYDSPKKNTAEEVVKSPDKSSNTLLKNGLEIKQRKMKVSNNKSKDSTAQKILARDQTFGKDTKRSRFPCFMCDKVFSIKKFFLKHQEKHFKNYQDNTKKVLKSKKKKNITHSTGKKYKSVSKKRKYVCKACKMSFTKKKDLTDHGKGHEIDCNLLEHPQEFSPII